MSLIVTNVTDEGVDVWVHNGVVIELSREEGDRLAVWAVRLDGTLYREPRDLEGEPLPEDSPFVREVKREMDRFQELGE